MFPILAAWTPQEWADRLDHSTPTLAQGQAAQGKIQALGAAAAAVGLGSLFAP